MGFMWMFSAACIVLFVLQRLAPWSYFNLFGFVLTPWLLLGLLIGWVMTFLLSIRTRRPIHLLPITVAVILLGSPYAAASAPSFTRPLTSPTRAAPLRVMSFNVWLSSASTNLDAIAQVIHLEHPDIVALQEMEVNLVPSLQGKAQYLGGHAGRLSLPCHRPREPSRLF